MSVYVRADLPVLEERIRRRGRPEEAHINLEFLARLQKCHDGWLLGEPGFPFPAPSKVLVLDGNLDKGEFVKMVREREGEILGIN